MQDSGVPGAHSAAGASDASGDPFRTSLSLCAHVLDAAAAGIALKDAEGVYRLANPAFAAALGRTADEIAGATDADLFAPADLPRLKEADRQALAGKAVADRPVAIPGTDPATWVQVDRKSLPGAAGVPAGIVVTLRDVTAERELAASETEKRRILDGFQDVGVHFADRDLEPVWFNDLGARLWAAGASSGSECGDSAHTVCPRRAARWTVSNAAAREDEIRLPGGSGEERDYWVRTQPVRTAGGEIRGALQVALDVTRRKRDEAIRCESEHLYQGLFWENPAASWFICAETGDILEANPAACRFYGYDAEAMRRKKVWDINLLPKEVVQAKMAEVKRSACMFDPFPHRLADGACRDVLVFSSPVRFRNRDCLYSIIVDITQRRRMELALRESRANMGAVLQSTHDLFASRDRSHRLMVYNSAFANICPRLFGVAAAQGLATADFLPPDRSRRWREKLDRVLAGESIEEEVSRPFVDGERRIYEVRLTPVRSGDQIIGTAEFSRDITERKRAEEELRRSEERFHSFMVHFPGFAFIKEADGRYIWANRSPAGDEIIPPERLAGRTDHEIFPAIFANQYEKSDREVRETGSRVQTVAAAPGRDRDRYQVISKFPIGSERPVARIGGMAIDITELVDTRERLRAALEEKETLLREVHHRVKNNLAVINSLLALQHRRVKDSPVRDALLESQSRISAMALIHENLYRGNRLGEVDFQRYAEDLGRSLAAAMATAAGARVSVNARGVVLPLTQAVTCGLILNELVTNSLKYAFPESKPGNIHISARRKAGGWIALRVKDDGAGLAPGFDQGPTLGMRIIRLLAERQLGGALRVERGGGACFVIEFPAEKNGRE